MALTRTKGAALGIAALAVGLAAAPTQAKAATPPSSSSYGTTLDILPPGSTGDVDAGQLATLGVGNTTAKPTSLLGNVQGAQAFLTTATATSPPNYADQLEQYDKLNTVAPSSLTDSTLTDYFKDSPLGIADSDVVRTETPRAGTTIKWDKAGVPHIFGDTDADVAYGAGIAVMEDRMFLTDVLRHTGAATMAQFVGATDADIAQDAAQLQVAPYTDAQDKQMIADLLAAHPTEGPALLAQLNDYVAGINAEQSTLCPLSTMASLPGNLGVGFGVHCPVEYALLQRPPQPYTVDDVISIASLVGGIFGTGGGGGYTNAIWLQQLEAKFGVTEGKQIYDDLREKDDPETPVTSPDPAPYGTKGGINPGLPGVAMPDLNPSSTALGTGAIVASDGSLSAPPKGAAGSAGDGNTTPPNPTPTSTTATSSHLGVNPAFEADAIVGELARAQQGEQTGMSNELIVDAKHGEGGHPVAVFGPQTGYYAPQLLMEEELEGPHLAARGVSFAGTNFVVELGHGLDYAWSATSPYTDITDTVVQKLCNADGSAPTTSSTSYVNEAGACTPMVQYEHTETDFPNVEAQAPPGSISFLVLRTDHGIVEKRTTVKGVPVSISLMRSTYGDDISSVLGFARLDDPAYVQTPKDFYDAVEGIGFTFNWYYVDATNIAYHLSAKLPVRSALTDLDLPRWGEALYDWKGYEPFSSLPQTTNPARGYIVNWNNHMAPGFDSSSETWGDGAVYRVSALEDRVKALIASGTPVTRAALTGAMIDAATVDTRGAYDLPLVLDVIGTPPASDPQAQAAVALLRAWANSGAHRVDRARTGAYDQQAAIELFDAWWDPQGTGLSCTDQCGFSLPLDAMSGLLGAYAKTIPEPIDDAPTQHIGSSFNGVVWLGYLSKDLRTLLGRKVTAPYTKQYCGAGSLAACRSALLGSLDKAITATLATQGASSLGALTYDKTRDDIVSVAGGVTAARPIDWQNRPTFQQVVEYTSHRPLPATPVTPVKKPGTKTKPVKITKPTGSLAATGLGAGVPLLALLLIALGWRLRRRAS